jgi:hypothetical protein
MRDSQSELGLVVQQLGNVHSVSDVPDNQSAIFKALRYQLVDYSDSSACDMEEDQLMLHANNVVTNCVECLRQSIVCTSRLSRIAKNMSNIFNDVCESGDSKALDNLDTVSDTITAVQEELIASDDIEFYDYSPAECEARK